MLTPNDFTDLAEVEARLIAFERGYEQTARPFEWKFTRAGRGVEDSAPGRYQILHTPIIVLALADLLGTNDEYRKP